MAQPHDDILLQNYILNSLTGHRGDVMTARVQFIASQLTYYYVK